MPNSTRKQPDIQWISSQPSFISIDKQRRFRLNAMTERILGLHEENASRYVMLGYDHANRVLIVTKPDVVEYNDVKPYKVDNRNYVSARPFLETLAIEQSALPIRFKYIGKDYAGLTGSVAFEMEERVAEGTDLI